MLIELIGIILLAPSVPEYQSMVSDVCKTQGVGKGTYSTRIADLFGFQHIAAGDLVRAEIKSGTALGKVMADITNSGHLLPDSLILKVVREKYLSAMENGTKKFLLDGFPRTVPQAEALEEFADVQLAFNLDLREEVLVEKCLGRRMCSKCGKNYNVANIYLEASDDRPAIIMPPLDPPEACLPLMERRADDEEETIRRRLAVYKAEAEPIEEFYRKKNVLLDFEITGGIPETLPALRKILEPYNQQITETCGSSGQHAAAA